VNRIIEADFGGDLTTDPRLAADDSVIAAYTSRGDPTPFVPVYEPMRRNITDLNQAQRARAHRRLRARLYIEGRSDLIAGPIIPTWGP
jgi:hypothetical protein